MSNPISETNDFPVTVNQPHCVPFELADQANCFTNDLEVSLDSVSDDTISQLSVQAQRAADLDIEGCEVLNIPE